MSRELEGRRISLLAFYASLLLLAYLVYRIVEPFLIQIGWAVVLAICLNPLQARLRGRLGATRAAVCVTALTLFVLILPVAFAVTALLNEGGQVVAGLQAQLADKGGAGAWLHAAWAWVREKLPFLPPEEEAVARVTASVGDVASFAASRAGGLLAGALGVLLGLLIILFLLFFLLRDAPTYAASLERRLPFGPAQNARLVTLTRDLVSASVTATVAISVLQGLIGGLGFALLGIQGAAVWGLVMGILAFVPVVGATLVWLPAGVWLLLSGSVGKGIALLALGIVVLGNVDNVVRPLVLSGKSRMNTLVTLVSLMGGVSAFGFIGIVLGPLVAAVVTALVESYEAEAESPAG
jgi:predicted PurR-regulated permease PerM